MKHIFEHKYYASFMLFFTLAFSLLFLATPNVAKVFQVLLIVGSLPIFFYHRDTIFKDPMIKLLGLIIICQLLSWVYSIYYQPDIANSGPKIDRLAKLFSFVFIAYWLKGKISNVYFLWVSLVVGFVLGCIVQGDFIQEILLGFNGERVDFNIKNAQFTSMFAGISLLIVIHLITQRQRLFSTYSEGIVFTLSAILVTLGGLLAFMIIITQSRQVWLALFVTALIAPLYTQYLYPSKKRKTIMASYLAIIILGFSLTQTNIVQERLARESQTIDAILAGDTQNIPMSSMGIRVNSWLEAINWIKKSPWVGHDNAAIGQVIQQSKLFTPELKLMFNHLHNYHIEVLVAYGFLGLTLVYLVYAWLIRSLMIQKNQNSELTPLLLFSLIFVTYWFIVNCFETFNGRSMGVYVHNVMFAGFYTFYLTNALNNKDA